MSPGTPGRDTVFVVSGGGRGVTARCVEHLAARFQSSFVLLGRTSAAGPEPSWAAGATGVEALRARAIAELQARGERPTPAASERLIASVNARREVLDTLKAVADAGGRATYVSADVTDRAALHAALAPALAAETGDLGLIHGAGVLADRPIGRKTGEDFDAVYQAKVAGLANLLACLPSSRLRYVALFASAAGFFGNPGQADYALANEVLNKAALLLARRNPTCRVISLNWGPWDGGMVTPELRRLFAERGVPLIPIADGARILADELSGAGHGVEVLVGGALAANTAAAMPAGRHRMRRRLTREANPFLRDHVFNGRAVLPAVVGAAWLAQGCEVVHPGYRVARVEEYRVYKGIVFDQDAPEELVLEVEPSDQELAFDARVWSVAEGGSRRPHYGARVTLVREGPAAPGRPHPRPLPEGEGTLDGQGTLLGQGTRDGGSLYEDGTLFHGPLFRGIRRVLRLDAAGVAIECCLPPLSERDQGQFPVRSLNYMALDVAFQAIVVWARRQVGAASVPLSWACCESYRPVPFGETFYATATITRHDASGAVADVDLHDEAGVCYARLLGAEVTISARLNEMFRMVVAPA